VSITVIQECSGDLDVLKALIAAQEGKRPGKLAGLTTVYQGEKVSLATAICKRGRILVSDAKIALGRQVAGAKRGRSGQDDADVELTREKQIENAKKVMADPEMAAEVVQDADALNGAYIATLDVRHEAWERENPKHPDAGDRRPRGITAAMKVLGGKATAGVEEWVADLRDAVDLPDKVRESKTSATRRTSVGLPCPTTTTAPGPGS
jgi:hypothetical protein